MIKGFEAGDARVAQEKALSAQKQIMDSQKQTMSAQTEALKLAMLEVPVDQLTVWVKRSEVQLPKNVASSDSFSYHYPEVIGKANTSDAMLEVYFHSPGQISIGPRFVDQRAKDFIYTVYSDALCGMEITPESVTDEPFGNPLLISADEISAVELTADQLRLTFKPARLRAAHLHNRKVRLEIRRGIVGALGNAPLPPTGPQCGPPKSIRLRFESFGLAADTAYFEPVWKSEFDDSFALSPQIVFQEAVAGDQPLPLVSSR